MKTRPYENDLKVLQCYVYFLSCTIQSKIFKLPSNPQSGTLLSPAHTPSAIKKYLCCFERYVFVGGTEIFMVFIFKQVI